ncbi:hypothetical protein DBR06_SOUSAS11910027, partial [Sousa chinensis]
PSGVFHPALTTASHAVKNFITKDQWLLTPRREYTNKKRIENHYRNTGQEFKEASPEASMEEIHKIDQL